MAALSYIASPANMAPASYTLLTCYSVARTHVDLEANRGRMTFFTGGAAEVYVQKLIQSIRGIVLLRRS